MTELIIKYAEPSAVMDRAVIPSEVVGTLVRCKDCVWWAINNTGICLNHLMDTEENDFCSWAKMKGGGE